MTTSFLKYSDILLDAYSSNSKSTEVAIKKQEILEELFNYYDSKPRSVLFIGFSPGILRLSGVDVYVTEVSDQVLNYLNTANINYSYIQRDQCIQRNFDVVVAVDEYLTFSNSDQDQRDKVTWLSNITNDFIITTLRDYKNQDYKDREFSQPICVRNGEVKKIFFEHYEYDSIDRNSCLGTSYCVEDEGSTIIGPFYRRSMFFKQLAKFSLDAGAKNFLVHKNLMHKSVIKKNYEHIITIRF